VSNDESTKPLAEYEFPARALLESLHYCVFPEELESDPLVAFHATASDILESIKADGFRPASDFGGVLESVSFARKSVGALTHWMTRRDQAGDAVIIAVRFDSLDGYDYDEQDIRLYPPKKQPEIIGICRFPSDYRHV